MKNLKPLFLLISLFFNAGTTGVAAQKTISDVPTEKQTSLGLYVTSAKAYDMWKADPEKVKILDVRTPEEYIFVGHAPMAWNIPAFDQVYEWDPEKQRFPMKPNPDFMEKITKVFKPDDVILVTCRSGGRSAMAANQLANAGFKNTYNITDGFKGDTVEDPNSVFLGERMMNGWKNSGLPYTYSIDPKLVLIPETK
jgi:rhodanese-related sulfurtransferase